MCSTSLSEFSALFSSPLSNCDGDDNIRACAGLRSSVTVESNSRMAYESANGMFALPNRRVPDTSSVSEPDLKRIGESLRELTASALHAVKLLVEAYLQNNKLLEWRFNFLDITHINSLLGQSDSIHHFFDQMAMREMVQVEALAQKYRERKRVLLDLRACELSLTQKLKPEQLLLVGLVQQMNQDGLKRVECEVLRYMKDRERAPFIPHPTRCFFLELPRELRNRVYIILGRLHVESNLSKLRFQEHHEHLRMYRERLRGRENLSLGLWKTNHQVRAEFRETLYSPEIVSGEVWDNQSSPPCWKPMDRSLLQKCFERPRCSGQVYSVLMRCRLEMKETNDSSRWQPEIKKIASMITVGPLPATENQLPKLKLDHWLSISTDIDKHLFMAYKWRSSGAVRLWGCECLLASEDQRELEISSETHIVGQRIDPARRERLERLMRRMRDSA